MDGILENPSAESESLRTTNTGRSMNKDNSKIRAVLIFISIALSIAFVSLVGFTLAHT